ncbi:solute carrier family 35 member G1 isoform X2 [Pezoporus wallicus]|uniref:solute carrier family 35 member G1 isoform X2 n=1 Tax=Pezoporus wallicus TaxID=35540 RepID=UPI00255192AF|nr:solute carrier family 35 member G1 isoform X2 [Pezoporus wallicus]XP_061315146.1 solute carrier family 35 member G1 isoform X2 [Pezoporus flaviventris]
MRVRGSLASARRPASGVEAAGAEERRGCGCCSGLSWLCCCKAPGAKKKAACPGLGLFYTVLSAFLFSVASLFLKKIEDVHSVEVSAFRCIFQMAFVLPGLIYYKTGFLGPKAVLFLHHCWHGSFSKRSTVFGIFCLPSLPSLE